MKPAVQFLRQHHSYLRAKYNPYECVQEARARRPHRELLCPRDLPQLSDLLPGHGLLRAPPLVPHAEEGA